MHISVSFTKSNFKAEERENKTLFGVDIFGFLVAMAKSLADFKCRLQFISLSGSRSR